MSEQQGMTACAICYVRSYGALTTCTQCGINVHAHCYGGVESGKAWTCAKCLSPNPGNCIVCGARVGALKPIVSTACWCHPDCLRWLPVECFLGGGTLNLAKLQHLS